uniref:Uncharacterized protein n=1 Tax=Cacopsylla melanoneura TaxID=428564 RepID=A0A8D9BPX2_9HEMI
MFSVTICKQSQNQIIELKEQYNNPGIVIVTIIKASYVQMDMCIVIRGSNKLSKDMLVSDVINVVEDSQTDPESERYTQSWKPRGYELEIWKVDSFGRENLSREWTNCGLRCHGISDLLFCL